MLTSLIEVAMNDENEITGSGCGTAPAPGERPVQEAGSERNGNRNVAAAEDNANENEGGDPRRDIEQYEQGQRPTKPDKG